MTHPEFYKQTENKDQSLKPERLHNVVTPQTRPQHPPNGLMTEMNGQILFLNNVCNSKNKILLNIIAGHTLTSYTPSNLCQLIEKKPVSLLISKLLTFKKILPYHGGGERERRRKANQISVNLSLASNDSHPPSPLNLTQLIFFGKKWVNPHQKEHQKMV